MISFRIHYTLRDGTEDSVLISAETIEEIREQAQQEIESRNAINPWSEFVA